MALLAYDVSTGPLQAMPFFRCQLIPSEGPSPGDSVRFSIAFVGPAALSMHLVLCFCACQEETYVRSTRYRRPTTGIGTPCFLGNAALSFLRPVQKEAFASGQAGNDHISRESGSARSSKKGQTLRKGSPRWKREKSTANDPRLRSSMITIEHDHNRSPRGSTRSASV